MLLEVPMVHNLIMPFSEDAQGGEACDVVLSTQVHLCSAVNLRKAATRC